MSSLTSSRVSGVVTGTAISVGVAATGILAKLAFAGFSAAANAAVKTIAASSNHQGKVLANSELRLKQSAIASQTQVQLSQYGLTGIEALKVETFATVVNTGYAIADQQQVMQNVQQIITASTVQQVNSLRQQCTQVLEANNKQVLVQSLTIACQNASLKTGFSQITTQNRQGKIRVIAKNYTGQALVSEIDVANQVQISTETVGITDGSCNAIIAQFEKALEEEGVIRQGTPDRKFTGGICKLSASQEFARNGVAPKQADSDKTAKSTKANAEVPRRQTQSVEKARQH
ncbi:hypothetical protein H6F42_20355 [Pseudanabaena sp. FACHB-1998]|uniref:hypothetical protein n=1 Tax=Pseudanabaena sp. FACHB-1998 TaxID=2692858 RepID=UPI001680FB89|nr:hypothetical protein [Pseudanabaena sp. FACHB-1998]MBD2179279.1 hypothetical protein [Pseudanabaena sp. FACHB-1998]